MIVEEQQTMHRLSTAASATFEPPTVNGARVRKPIHYVPHGADKLDSVRGREGGNPVVRDHELDSGMCVSRELPTNVD